MKLSKVFSFSIFILSGVYYNSSLALAQIGFGPPLPTHEGIIHLDLNPGLEVDEIPGLLPNLDPVIGTDCFSFGSGFNCRFTDIHTGPIWNWEVGITNTSSIAGVALGNVDFAWPGPGSPIIGALQLAPETTFTIDINVLDRPEVTNKWIFQANSTGLGFPVGIDTAVTENSNMGIPGDCTFSFSNTNTFNQFLNTSCTNVTSSTTNLEQSNIITTEEEIPVSNTLEFILTDEEPVQWITTPVVFDEFIGDWGPDGIPDTPDDPPWVIGEIRGITSGFSGGSYLRPPGRVPNEVGGLLTADANMMTTVVRTGINTYDYTWKLTNTGTGDLVDYFDTGGQPDFITVLNNFGFPELDGTAIAPVDLTTAPSTETQTRKNAGPPRIAFWGGGWNPETKTEASFLTPTSVPESSSVLAILTFGVLGISWNCLRKS